MRRVVDSARFDDEPRRRHAVYRGMLGPVESSSEGVAEQLYCGDVVQGDVTRRPAGIADMHFGVVNVGGDILAEGGGEGQGDVLGRDQLGRGRIAGGLSRSKYCCVCYGDRAAIGGLARA